MSGTTLDSKYLVVLFEFLTAAAAIDHSFLVLSSS
jgi:hypothetical protein